jgi:hypothetical protein
MNQITAKIKLDHVQRPGGGGEGTTTLRFQPDYADGRNKEWAMATPSLSLAMTVKDAVAEQFNQGDAYTLTFSQD